MKTAKAVVTAVGAIVTVLTAALADNVFNASETGTTIACVVEQGITVWTVWKMRNKGYVYDPIKYNNQAR
jgi:hypothetical protein